MNSGRMLSCSLLLLDLLAPPSSALEYANGVGAGGKGGGVTWLQVSL